MPTMYGPAFDESGEIVERDVPETDVRAFENAGYKLGAKPVEETSEPESEPETATEPETEEEKPQSRKKGK